MFTFTDTVANGGAGAITLAPYGSVQRQGLPAGLGVNSVVHEGGVAWLDGKRKLLKYKKWEKDGGGPSYNSPGGWIGITDKYWMSVLVPDPKAKVDVSLKQTGAGADVKYQVDYVGSGVAVAPGATSTTTAQLFAGAKIVRSAIGWAAIDWLRQAAPYAVQRGTACISK